MGNTCCSTPPPKDHLLIPRPNEETLAPDLSLSFSDQPFLHEPPATRLLNLKLRSKFNENQIVTINTGDSVSSLKQLFLNENGLVLKDGQRVRMIFGGREMLDHDLIAEYHIKVRCTVSVFIHDCP